MAIKAGHCTASGAVECEGVLLRFFAVLLHSYRVIAVNTVGLKSK
jgi:hypothetical protein